MINDKAILVGVDGSDASYKATWWAANYAKHAGLTLQIVCAYSLPSYAAVSFDATYTAMGDDNAAHSDAQEILSRAKAIADEQGVEAATLIVTGDPASVFVELSRNYNLIVIGNRGKGGLAERLLGTTSSSLPAYAYCPVVVVPYTDDDGNLMHLNNTITKVAVGADESKWGVKALSIAAAFADSWDAELDVISAVPKIDGVTGSGTDEEHGVMASYLDDLEVRVKPLREEHPNLVINKQLVPGSAVNALTEASHNHDVVIVGSRGRGGFTGLLLGSTSQGLLQHSVSPVYVVPRKYVEAAEQRLDSVPASPADVSPKPIDDIQGVKEVPVPKADASVAHDIESTIDPLHK
ncbi:universal stress protein [Bifidobacterium sp. DSM 109958]|uniref:Universal stress protein n=1 Tax=Bifidobacterium moraviense TaxID=2675323 RepID=A0A7Y0F133_9BIFI|nr:universal stress protein [Bifidobacterium sp. DSM 109958]NMN00075.1 universal stress protein [Bifidobacterium sp. DSM 109958]